MHPLKHSFARWRRRNWAFRLLALAGLSAGMLGGSDVRATPTTFTFPAPNPGWVIARNGGQPVTDVEGDTPGARDIVGDAANPMLYVASDATHLYFRLRLDSDPLQNATNFGPFGWGCLINTDSNLQTFEFSTVVDGVNNPDTIFFYKNTVTTMLNNPADPPDTPAVNSVQSPLTAAVGHAEVASASSMFGGDADFFIDWAVELAPLLAAGFNPANPANYYCGSANSNQLGADCSGGAVCGALDTQFTDPIACGPLGCAICGDGQKGAAEGCDDGNRVNGDGCNSVCLLELGQSCAGMSSACASGFCDPAGNICACDANSDCPSGKLCSLTPNPNICVNPGCGNNILEAGEGCDDGNTLPGDGCNGVCLKELGQACVGNIVCASGFCDADANQCACDQNADCPTPNVCNVIAVPNICVAPGCGNHVLEAGEGCDDGNINADDGCDPTCLLEIGQPCPGSNNACASGFCDPMGNLCQCDDDGDCVLEGYSCNLALTPHQCVPSGCGNGMLNFGEGCDDGNLNNGDGCNAQCLKELGRPCTMGNVCASGFCDAMVCACDADIDCPSGKLCSIQSTPNACVNPGCGNFVVEIGEGCDDGNTTSNDGCNNACLLELGEACVTSTSCASGACDPIDSTCVCDENADCPAATPVCKLSADPNLCVVAGCGNGVVEMGEGCDDNNKTSGDGCSSGCLLEIGLPCPGGATTCASGFCDPTGTVCSCNENADCSATQLCDLLAAPHLCVDPGCGNGVVEANEGCDDGNVNSNDGCTSTCKIEIGQSCTLSNTCITGFCDPSDNTCACDQDSDCSGGQVCNTKALPHKCVDPGCGNFVLEANEGCDDGNLMSGDGCNALCSLEEGQTCNGSSNACESGYCDPSGDICACDDDGDCANGNLCNTAADPNVCVPPGCGNAVLEPNEGCDDGNTAAGDGCDASCLIELGKPCTASTSCASGLCDMDVCACDQDMDCGAGEVCDTTAAPNACVPAGCGNAVLEPNEGCDDGNTMPGDGCAADCTKELGEMCTDGPECGSGHCDNTVNQCVCDKDADCPMGKICNTKMTPHACIVPPTPGCVADKDCAEGLVCNQATKTCVQCTADVHCTTGVCDELSEVCVECTNDSECTNGGTCNKETHMCKTGGIVIEGGGFFCAVSPTSSGHDRLPLGLLGLASLGLLRRRRR